MEINKIWKRYEKAHDYMQLKGLVTRTNKNWNFYIGNHWEGLESGGEKLPSLNFIKSVIKYKVATIAQNSMTANYSDFNSDVNMQPVYDILNNKFSQSWEKAKMDLNAWQLIKEASIQGDSYALFGTGDTNKPPQILANTSILLGDENTVKLQDQPWLIIVERLELEAVKQKAKENNLSAEDISSIATDNDTTDQLINKDEVSNKVTSLLYMEKINGIVNIARATKSCVYEPLRPVETYRGNIVIGGLKSYPIVPFIWEQKPNSARGVGEVEVLIPNQMELNKTLARRALTVKLTAYPRLAYDTNMITNPQDLDTVGAAIGVNSGGAQSINQAISYLNATSMSSDAAALLDDLLSKTKDLAGASEFALGNINPERASGSAIIAVRDQSQVPLNEQVRSFTQFCEDVSLLWFDLWATYDTDSFSYQDENGNTIKLEYEQIMDLKPTVRIDVSQDNKWTKMAEQQTIDNLLQTQQITFDEYVMLCPANGSVPKGKLEILLDRRKQVQAKAEEQQRVQAEQNAQMQQNTQQTPQEVPQETPQEPQPQ